ncbi:MAG: hypothetical protein Q9172_003019 [Xanthocarpia lactea]
MHLLSLPVLIYLAFLLLVDAVAALPANQTTPAHPTKPKFPTLEARVPPRTDRCFEKGVYFSTHDLFAYANMLQTHDADKVHYLAHGHYNNGVHGSLQACVYNHFNGNSENTAVPNREVGMGLQRIYEKCCPEETPVCLAIPTTSQRKMHLLSTSLFVFAPLLLTTTVTSLPLPKRDLIPVGLEPHDTNRPGDGPLWMSYTYAEYLHEHPPKAKEKRSTSSSISPILEPHIPIVAEYPSSKPSGLSSSTPDNDAAPPPRSMQSSLSSKKRSYPDSDIDRLSPTPDLPFPAWGPGTENPPKRGKRAEESV